MRPASAPGLGMRVPPSCAVPHSLAKYGIVSKNETALGRRPIPSLPILPRLGLIGSNIGSNRESFIAR